MRVEDALHATRAAVAEGIVPGGGIALLRARRVLAALKGATLDEDSGIRIVAQRAGGAAAVHRQPTPASSLRWWSTASTRRPDANHGYNAATRTYGDLLQMGVIDPVKVTRLALQNAGSIAGLVLTTDCLIAQAPAPRREGRPSEGEEMPAF